MARECGWPGHVFQVVTGTGATGQALADEADFVMFTGSTRTGRAVAERAAGRLIPHTLELGGKDALIVLADAPLDRAVNLAVHGSLFNGGQACNAVERIYAEDAIYEAFTEAVRRRLQQLRTGPAGALGTVAVGCTVAVAELSTTVLCWRIRISPAVRPLTNAISTKAAAMTPKREISFFPSGTNGVGGFTSIWEGLSS